MRPSRPSLTALLSRRVFFLSLLDEGTPTLDNEPADYCIPYRLFVFMRTLPKEGLVRFKKENWLHCSAAGYLRSNQVTVKPSFYSWTFSNNLKRI